MRNFKLFVLIFSVLTTLLFSCRTSKNNKISNIKSAWSYYSYASFTEAFMNGVKEKNLGNYEPALKEFEKALAIDPQSTATMYEIAQIYSSQLNRNKDALILAQKIYSLDKKNQYYKALYAKLLKLQGENSKAAKIWGELFKEYIENRNYFYEYANSLVSSNNIPELFKVFDEYEKVYGKDEMIISQRISILEYQNKKDQVIAEYQKLIAEFPKEPDYYKRLGDYYMRIKETDKAFETYKKLLELDPENAEVRLSLSDYYWTKGDKLKAFDEMKIAFANANLNIDIKMKILLSYFAATDAATKDENLKKEAYDLLDILEKAHPDDPKSYSVSGDFLYRDKKISESRDKFLKVLSLDSSRFAVWQQVMIIDSELNDYISLEKHSSAAIDLFPNQAVCYLFNGMALIQLKKYDDAIISLNRGKSLTADNKLILAEFYTNIGEAHNNNKNYPDADKAFEKSLELKPDNSYVMNNYSYYLSLRGEKLERAEELGKRLNEISPNISTYQDTYGWILYRMKKFEDAAKWLEKAVNNGGTGSAVILEHYGDALFQIKQPDKALEFWQKAKEKGKASDFLDQKIREKKLFE